VLESEVARPDAVEISINRLKVHFALKQSMTAVLLSKPKKVVRAVDDVSLEVRRNEVLGLVGETGCGKSTIAKTILRMNPISGGTILYRGVDVQRLSGQDLMRYYSAVQMVWQDPSSCLNPRMQVGEILSRPLIRFKKIGRREALERIRPAMRIVGLNENEVSRYPHEFSGGGKQRIVIARALINEPSFLIADEPTSSLDVSIQAQILNLIKSLKNSLGLTMLYISHNLSTISFLSTRVAVMYFGRIVELLPNENMTRRNYHWYTRRLIDAIPKGTRMVNAAVSQESESRLNHQGCIYYFSCENAKQRCREERPELREMEREHLVACHYPIEHGRSEPR
jgi:oligopeptide/dipeptide ABC transporter ATP-binding protein